MASRVIVTGGGDSIGRATAGLFHGSGDEVFICDMAEENLSATIEANPGIAGELADLGSHEGTKEFFDTALSALGGCDVLVSTVGAGEL